MNQWAGSRAFCIVSTLVFTFSQYAHACECAPPPPPCQAIGGSELVFLGSVLSVGDGGHIAKMRVDQSFKGSLPGEVELFDDGMCDGPILKVGRQYLMYTFGDPGHPIPARGCTRSRAVEDAKEDLQFLKEYVAGKTRTQISGTVRYRPNEPEDSQLGDEGRTPMKDVSIMISGEGRSYKSKTDASGHYAISSLPPGKYEVRAELAGYREDWARKNVKLAAKGCAVEDVLMQVDRRVVGTVRSKDGAPIPDAIVQMVPVKPGSERWENPVLLSFSDENGLYAIDGIPPGDYYLGINIGSTPTKEYPFPPTYYPNTRNVAEAIPLSISVGAAVRNFDLIAPPKLKVILVRGIITDATGQPPQNRPQVRIKEPGLYGQIETNSLAIDSEGRFTIELCEGVRYSAFAFGGFPKDTVYSEPVEFTAGETELHFVLNKTAEEFRQLRPLH